MHYETFRDHDYLGAWNFEGGDRTLTIDRVEQGFIEREDGTKERVPLLFFRELALPMVLNSTNGKMIFMMYGTPDVRQWVGKRITLTTALTTNTSGQPVMGIRVHPQRPPEVTIEESPSERAARLEAELAELKKAATQDASRPALAPTLPASAPASAPEVAHAG